MIIYRTMQTNGILSKIIRATTSKASAHIPTNICKAKLTKNPITLTKTIHVILFLFLSIHIFAQKVSYNSDIDTSDAKTKEIAALFEKYITSHPEKKEKNLFWNMAEQEKYRNYDFLESEFQPSLYMGFPIHVLSIKFKDDICQIKAQFSYCNADGSPNVLAIVNYAALKENGQYKLHNYLTQQKKHWKSKTVGPVNFYYPSYHTFDVSKAKKLNEFINQTCNTFGVQPKPIEYYLANDYDEIQQLKGIDYYIGMGSSNSPRGKACENKVYCGGLGEYYTHEVFHVLIDEHFPNKHFWISEGIATLLGGSRGKSLEWHIKRTHLHLQKHPEIDLNNMLQLYNLDSITSYHYVLGGLIAKKIKDKGGWNLLKTFMSSGTTDEDYYSAIEEFLGVKKTELNKYIREQLQIESQNITNKGKQQ